MHVSSAWCAFLTRHLKIKTAAWRHAKVSIKKTSSTPFFYSSPLLLNSTLLCVTPSIIIIKFQEKMEIREKSKVTPSALICIQLLHSLTHTGHYHHVSISPLLKRSTSAVLVEFRYQGTSLLKQFLRCITTAALCSS